MYEVIYWSGSSFGGHVCDDGEYGSLGHFPLDVARQQLKAYCDRQVEGSIGRVR